MRSFKPFAEISETIAMFRESWRQMWDKAAEFLNNKIDVLVNNAGVSPKLGYDICMKVNNVVISKVSDFQY